MLNILQLTVFVLRNSVNEKDIMKEQCTEDTLTKQDRKRIFGKSGDKVLGLRKR